MRIYRVIVRADKWASEYPIQASNFATAAARGAREWQSKFKGSRISELSIKIIRGGELLKAEKIAE